MIRFTLISRAGDGLPLVATMESQRDEEEIAAHKKMSKSIIKILGPEGSLTGRQAVAQDAGSISADEFTFHYINDSGIIFLALCHHRYPRVLAFAFLDELVNAFLAELTGAGAQNTRVNAVRRPYSFIRFEPTIQSIKKRYENTHRLRPNGDLADLSARVTNIPVYQVTDVLGPSVSITSESFHSFSPLQGLPSLRIPSIPGLSRSQTATSRVHQLPQAYNSRALIYLFSAVSLIDLVYLFGPWLFPVLRTSLWTEGLLRFALGLLAPVVFLVAYKHHNSAGPPELSNRIADVVTTHTVLTLIELLFTAVCKAPPADALVTTSTIAAVTAYLSSWCVPLPIVALKAAYVLVATVAVTGQNVQLWIRKWRSRKGRHSD